MEKEESIYKILLFKIVYKFTLFLKTGLRQNGTSQYWSVHLNILFAKTLYNS